ncbi:hypothetical protein AWZ03_007632 [Drosophila navojoa]|uniref:Uncharacterized protein n=1 Tax=Drosophila navojoa TaxID=7232 RepID=A0A484BC71_DRONA|nr:hypothetical protein AWZ03_007632 [Drosophila navojoa]
MKSKRECRDNQQATPINKRNDQFQLQLQLQLQLQFEFDSAPGHRFPFELVRWQSVSGQSSNSSSSSGSSSG